MITSLILSSGEYFAPTYSPALSFWSVWSQRNNDVGKRTSGSKGMTLQEGWFECICTNRELTLISSLLAKPHCLRTFHHHKSWWYFSSTSKALVASLCWANIARKTLSFSYPTFLLVQDGNDAKSGVMRWKKQI